MFTLVIQTLSKHEKDNFEDYPRELRVGNVPELPLFETDTRLAELAYTVASMTLLRV